MSHGILKGEVSMYHWPPVWFGISYMTTDNFCLYLQNRLIKTSQIGGQWYSDTSSFSIPCMSVSLLWCNLSFSSSIIPSRNVTVWNENYFVVIKEDEFPDAASRQHFGSNGSYSADPDDGDGTVSDLFVVRNDAHPLQSHQSRVGVRVDHLRRHFATRILSRHCFTFQKSANQRNTNFKKYFLNNYRKNLCFSPWFFSVHVINSGRHRWFKFFDIGELDDLDFSTFY